jgi:hypothetical protein
LFVTLLTLHLPARLPSLGTTAIVAQMNAPNKEEAKRVSENVEKAKDAANEAASVAKVRNIFFCDAFCVLTGSCRH